MDGPCLRLISPKREHPSLRLFCFPHAGGTPQFFAPWAARLPESVEIFALLLPGRLSKERVEIPEMTSLVASYLDDLVRAAGECPIALFGHSVGGLIAFETALQLAENPLLQYLIISAVAPPIRMYSPTRPMHTFPNEELIREIEKNGALPDVSEEFTEYILPSLRADFKLAEMYVVEDTYFVYNENLRCKVLITGGRNDESVSHDAIHEWGDFLKLKSPQMETFFIDGGHFYLQESADEFFATITQRLCPGGFSNVCGPEKKFYDERMPIGDLFVRQALLSPSHPCLVDAISTLSYEEVLRDSEAVAQELLSKGTGPKSLVAIFMEHSNEYVIAMIAILRIGAAFVPLETAYPPRALRKSIECTSPSCVFTTNKFLDPLHSAGVQDSRIFLFTGEWRSNLCKTNTPMPVVTLDNSAFCVMSSGTTGDPKGIIGNHRAMINSYTHKYEMYPYSHLDDSREACSIFFVWEVLRPLLVGHTAFILPDETLYEPERLLDYLEENSISRMLFTPTMLEQFVNAVESSDEVKKKLASLRYVWTNGEVVTVAMCKRFLEFFPSTCRLGNVYSISETYDVSVLDLRELDLSNFEKFVPVGLPNPNMALHVLDDNLLPVPTGHSGEVFISGDNINGSCYYNDPIKTSERFLVIGGKRTFRTGDCGRILPGGFLEIQGRKHFMIKLRGYTIVLSAVEAAIGELSDLVKTVAVTTHDDPETLQPSHLIAYIVPSKVITDKESAITKIRQRLRSLVPHYAIPSFFVFVEEIPVMASSGKLDRNALPLPPELSGEQRPQTFASSDIASLWKEVLGVSTIDAAANFFDVGGNSLLAIRLCNTIQKRYGKPISVGSFFVNPTIGFIMSQLSQGIKDTSARKDYVDHAPTRDASEAIAIIGMAGTFPGCRHTGEFWQSLLDGRIHIVSEGKRCTTIPEPIKFDPAFWGIADGEASLIDPQHRVFLECCYAALQSSGVVDPLKNCPPDTGVYAGCYSPLYLVNSLDGAGFRNDKNPVLYHLTEVGNDKDYISTRVSYVFNLSGPSQAVQTSCSTSLSAVIAACDALRLGHCRNAIAGASSIAFPLGSGNHYVEGHIFSKDGYVRPFDVDASGTILTDGCGVVILKLLSNAERDGDNILSVIRGYSINNDGKRKANYSAPSVDGQVDNIAGALIKSGVNATALDFIEAHGTATHVGDAVEVVALTSALRLFTEDLQYCALTSAKGNVGHCNIAAGMVGLIKTVFCLQAGMIPPSPAFSAPNPSLNITSTPFYLSSDSIHNFAPSHKTRVAMVCCLGIGGTNCHMVVESHEKIKPIHTEEDRVLLPFSAHTAEALQAYQTSLLSHFSSGVETEVLHKAALTLEKTRILDHPFRQCLLVSTKQGRSVELTPISYSAAPVVARPPVVLLFTGQGTQHPLMGRDLYLENKRFRATFDECASLFRHDIGVDLRDAIFQEELPRSNEAAMQALLFAVEYSCAHCALPHLKDCEIVASMGHSLGEIVAATVSNLLSLQDAVKLVVLRSQLIDRSAGTGAMLAVVTLPPHPTFADDELCIAGKNSPSNTVYSGSVEAIKGLEERLSTHKAVARTRPLKVRRAFHHSTHLALVAQELERKLQISCPRGEGAIPFINNVTAEVVRNGELLSPAYWSKQVISPVRFEDCVRKANELVSNRPILFVEVGAGRTLSSFALETLPKCSAIALMSHPLESANRYLHFRRALGSLYCHGAPVTFSLLPEPLHRSQWLLHDLPPYCFHPREILPPSAGTKRPKSTSSMLPPENRCYALSWGKTAVRPTPRKATPAMWLICSLPFSKPSDFERRVAQEILRSNPDAAVRTADELLVDVLQENKCTDLLLVNRTDKGTYDLYFEVLHFAQQLSEKASSKDSLRLWVVTENMTHEQKPSECAQGAIYGLSLVIQQELASFCNSVRIVDIPTYSSEVAAKSVVNEILCTGMYNPSFTTRREGAKGRFVQMFTKVPLCMISSESYLSGENGTFIITGAFGKLGRLLTKAILSSDAGKECRLVLTTRKSSVNATELQPNCVVECNVNLGDSSAIRSLIAKYDDIRGVFHCAGLADLKPITALNRDVSNTEFTAKAVSVSNFDAALPENALIVTFSSLAAILGGIGMAAYSAANSAMDLYCEAAARLHPDRTYLNVLWDDWDDGREEAQDPTALPPQECFDLLFTLIAQGGSGTFAVSHNDLHERLSNWVYRMKNKPKKLLNGEPSCSTLLEEIRKAFTELLPQPDFGNDSNFFDIGGDSLLAIQLIAALNSAASLRGKKQLTLKQLFDTPTPAGIEKLLSG